MLLYYRGNRVDFKVKYAYRDSWGWEQPQQQCQNIGLGSGKTTKDGLKDGLHKLWPVIAAVFITSAWIWPIGITLGLYVVNLYRMRMSHLNYCTIVRRICLGIRGRKTGAYFLTSECSGCFRFVSSYVGLSTNGIGGGWSSGSPETLYITGQETPRITA